jgi:hypothetical protein
VKLDRPRFCVRFHTANLGGLDARLRNTVWINVGYLSTHDFIPGFTVDFTICEHRSSGILSITPRWIRDDYKFKAAEMKRILGGFPSAADFQRRIDECYEYSEKEWDEWGDDLWMKLAMLVQTAVDAALQSGYAVDESLRYELWFAKTDRKHPKDNFKVFLHSADDPQGK